MLTRHAIACLLPALFILPVAARQAPATASQSPAPLRDRLQAKFEELHKAGSFPGGRAGIALADGTTIGLAVGLSDRATGTPMTPTDRLLLGSVGKTYASAVALQLMKELLNGVPARLGPETSYGLGVIIRPTAHGITYGHSGFMPGYQTDVMYFPELKAAVAVQVNSSAPRSTGRPLRAFITDLAEVVVSARD